MTRKPSEAPGTRNGRRNLPPAKPGLHPRNKHNGRYDFELLRATCPELATFVKANAYGDDSIDFADAQAVRTLNRALLKQLYGIEGWNLPEQYLCPPIPGRADYLHHLADLLAASNNGQIPRGKTIRVLDIGVGANCVYPLIGHSEYGWSFVGSDTNPEALACAQTILDANSSHRTAVELRLQPAAMAIFNKVLQPDELFDLTMSNPPFHASIAEAAAGSERKWKNLGKTMEKTQAPALNFGGRHGELCCDGGEAGFISRMIAESMAFANNCLWFTSLVAKATSLPAIYRALKNAGVAHYRTIEMGQGQKRSRIIAWSFFNSHQQRAWRNRPKY